MRFANIKSGMLRSKISALYYLSFFFSNFSQTLGGFCSKTAIIDENGSLSCSSIQKECVNALLLARADRHTLHVAFLLPEQIYSSLQKLY